MFTILDLDRDVAIVVGDIAADGLKGRQGEKQRVKIDVEIVACAIRWQAEGLCFLDGDHEGIVRRNGLSLKTGRPSAFSVPQRPLYPDKTPP